MPSLYLPQLDGLRFIAALLVFSSHAPLLPNNLLSAVQTFGWCGVDIFLVLSAFLLTRLLRLEADHTGTIDIKRFYVRRILRIWPLHWAFVSAMLVVHAILYRADIKSGIGFWLSHLFFVNNAILATLGFERRLAFTSHLWTISLEEQFYLFIPVAMLWFCRSKISDRSLAMLLTLLVVALMGMRTACVLVEMPFPFIMVLPLRGDAIVLGVFLGLGVLGKTIDRLPSTLRFLAGCGLLGIASRLPSLEIAAMQQIPGFTLIALGAALMVSGVTDQNFITRALSITPLKYLGKISFGIYVFHSIGIAVGKRALQLLNHAEPWVIFVASLMITISMAALSYEFFEKRFIVFKHRFAAVQSRPA